MSRLGDVLGFLKTWGWTDVVCVLSRSVVSDSLRLGGL